MNAFTSSSVERELFQSLDESLAPRNDKSVITCIMSRNDIGCAVINEKHLIVL